MRMTADDVHAGFDAMQLRGRVVMQVHMTQQDWHTSIQCSPDFLQARPMFGAILGIFRGATVWIANARDPVPDGTLIFYNEELLPDGIYRIQERMTFDVESRSFRLSAWEKILQDYLP